MQNKWAFIFHSVFIWCCYIGGTYLGFYATLGTEQLPFIATFPVLAFASIGMILTPGGIGAYPWFIKEVMIRYGIEEGIANANGILQWVAQCVIILVVGFICLALLPYFNKKKDLVSSRYKSAEFLKNNSGSSLLSLTIWGYFFAARFVFLIHENFFCCTNTGMGSGYYQ